MIHLRAADTGIVWWYGEEDPQFLYPEGEVGLWAGAHPETSDHWVEETDRPLLDAAQNAIDHNR